MSVAPRFGVFDLVPLGDAWAHEAREFTPWLAKNLDRLTAAVGFPLELEGMEVAVESFAADIVARNPLDNTKVLIENQLAPSDHSHLGQILTYLAGLDAKAIIWIAPLFREAHLSAIKWLNENTAEGFSFFAVELSVVRIGPSPMVPVFEVVERPNHWDRDVHAAAVGSSIREEGLGEFRRRFWSHLMRRHPSEGDASKPFGASSKWRELADLKLVVASYISYTGPGIFIRCPRGGDDEAAAELLAQHERILKDRLDADMNTNPRYLFIKQLMLDLRDAANWDRAADWLHSEADRYERVLREVIGRGAR